MACKQSELVEAINSYAAARASSDAKLQQFAVAYLQQLVETLEFSPEDEAEAEVVHLEPFGSTNNDVNDLAKSDTVSKSKSNSTSDLAEGNSEKDSHGQQNHADSIVSRSSKSDAAAQDAGENYDNQRPLATST